jgi:hypothetical protein
MCHLLGDQHLAADLDMVDISVNDPFVDESIDAGGGR